MAQRIQRNLLAQPERRLLDALCRRMPPWVTSDRLTLFAVAGGGLVALGYGLSRWSRPYLLLCVLGYAMHWFGDSLDGSLARYRGVERPRYGGFVDQAADAFSNLMIFGGIGLTTMVRMDVALFAVVGYLLLANYVSLKAQAFDQFQLSFLAAGPTEMRLCLIVFTLVMLKAGPVWVQVLGRTVSAYDLFIGAVGLLCVALAVGNVLETAARLRRSGE